MIICSCEKMITFAHRRQIINLMHMDPISVHCVVITIQAPKRRMVIMKIKIVKLTFLGIILFFSINAYAGQLDSSGLLDILLDKFQQVASTWTTVIADYANWLFWGLVLISMVWTFWYDGDARGRIDRRTC